MRLPSWPFKPNRRLLQRTAVTAGVTAAHVLFFALLCLDFRPAATGDAGGEGKMMTLSLVDTAPASAPPAAQPTPQPPAPAKPAQAEPAAAPAAPSAEPADVETVSEVAPAEEAVPSQELQLSEADSLALASFEMPASAGTMGQACNLTPMLASGFAASPAVAQGLMGLPASQRSVANAVMLWDGGWPEDSLSGGKALLRALLTKAVSSAPPECLTQAQRGPVLFFVPDNGMTAVLAVGSGEWQWGDLIAPETPSNYFLSAASEFRTTP